MSTDIDPQVRRPGETGAPAHRPNSLGRDLPRVPRRYGQWAASVLFVLMAVLVAGWLWQQRSDRIPVLVTSHAVAAGAVITPGDLKIVDIAGVPGALSSSQSRAVVGSTAAVGLVAGQVLTGDMVTRDPIPGPGERVIGLQLDATRAPSGLVAGDVVSIVAVPPSGDPSTPELLDSPTVLTSSAKVETAQLIEGAGTRLTLLVPDAVADRVASYVAAGRVALVQAPIGGEG